MTAQYFEDLEVGDVVDHGSYTVTDDEIVAFAEQYDPQPFHIDREIAGETMYGGLIASGWHTAGMTMRLLVEGFLGDVVAMGAKGVDELRWRRPVRPGDTLSIRNEIVAKEPETDERGLVRSETTTYNQDGEAVFSMLGLIMVERRGEG